MIEEKTIGELLRRQTLTTTRYRNKAIIRLLFDCGLKISDIQRIKNKDLTQSHLSYRNISVPLSIDCKNYINKYIEYERKEVLLTSSSPFFLSRDRCITYREVHYIFRDMPANNKCIFQINFIWREWKKGTDVNKICSQVGYKNPRSVYNVISAVLKEVED